MPLPTFRPDRVGELRGKGVVDPSCTRMRLAQTQVWPALRYFEATAPCDRRVQIGVVEDDEGRVAAELEGIFFIVGAHCAMSSCRPRSIR